MLSDEELIEEILRGSQAAMEVLVKRHYKSVFAYVYRKTGDYHTAFDLTQEVFIKMLKALHHYNGVGKFTNWLFKIAHNSCLDHLRASQAKECRSKWSWTTGFRMNMPMCGPCWKRN